MARMDKFDYKKAEADLEDQGVPVPEDIYGIKSERGMRSYLREHDLNPNRYFSSGGSGSKTSSSDSSDSYDDWSAPSGQSAPSNSSWSNNTSDDVWKAEMQFALKVMVVGLAIVLIIKFLSGS